MALLLIMGFLAVDFLFLHDVFKPGEVTTLPQYLTAILSLPVIIYAAYTVFGEKYTRNLR